MTRLGSVATGRDNNLNLIRMLAAFAVLVSHAWPLDLGSGTPEPLKAFVGQSLGTLAVYVFFVISGFLITASFQRTHSRSRFVLARVLRLLPGLAVSLLIVAFCLGPLVTTWPVADYLRAPETWMFLVRNLTMALPQYTLPGVFDTNPYPAVEGSIWTLIHEVLCYVMVFAAGVAGLLGSGRRMAVFLGLYAAGWALTLAFSEVFPERLLVLRNLSLPFVIGMAGWIWRDRVVLSVWVVPVLGLAWFGLRDTALAFPALTLFVCYATAWFAFIPSGGLHVYNRLGDYSYGIYIYAFPVQGLIVWAFGSLGPVLHIALATPPVVILSVMSWHVVERPALQWLKRRRPGPVPPRQQAPNPGPTPAIPRGRPNPADE